MKIFYIASVRIPNEKASGLAIMRQCEAFAHIGHDVTLVCPHRKNHIKENPFIYYGIDKIFDLCTIKSIDLVDWFGVVGFYITRLSQMLGSFILLWKRIGSIDVIYARDPWMLILPILFWGKRKRIIWEAHQVQKGVFINFVARNVELLVCISSGLVKQYAKVRGEKRTIMEPSGVNIEQFENLPLVSELRRSFGLLLDKKIIAYIGKYKTMGEEKGIDELIEAFASVHATHPETHLLIVGLEENEMQLVAHTCSECSISNGAFTLLPLVQKDFALYVHSADILVMNYPDVEHYRNFMSPTKLFAYMASKKVIVASDLPSVRDVAGDNSIFYSIPSDIDSLIRTLNLVCENSDTLQEKSKTAFERVKTFEWISRAKRIFN